MPTKRFPEGVEIYLPNKYKDLKVKRKVPKGGPVPNKVGRVVMNFYFHDPQTNDKYVGDLTVKDDDGNIIDTARLLVKYTVEDDDRAANANRNLELRYDPGTGWVPIPNVIAKIPHGNGFGGVWIVEIHRDPAVGWFP
ncbi:MAG: hypothetical protein ACXADB_14510 [Candidatus Hermodarchaeia archaeon]|jgi:hypothetical protein